MAKAPSYRLHKATGQARVTLGGTTYNLGVHGSEESKSEYRRLLAEWKAQGGQLFKPGPDGLSVNEVLLAYVKAHATYYRKNGRSTGELELVKYALRIVKNLYGHKPASEFGPLALKACRNEMIEIDWSRKTINNHVGRIKRVFRWATENELVPPSIYQALSAVAGLKRGRSAAKESEPIRPVPEADIEAVIEVLPAPVAAMVRLQVLTGMRPGEVVAMRGREIHRGSAVWRYVPDEHKTEHHGHERVVFVGPKAQAVLRPFLKADPDAYLFSPSEAEEARRAARRLQRKSPMTPSQAKRQRKRRPKRSAGEQYTVRSYRRCIARACAKADVPHWHPHRLRHNAATEIRKQVSAEAARVCLGHSRLATTEIYAERDLDLASRVMAKWG